MSPHDQVRVWLTSGSSIFGTVLAYANGTIALRLPNGHTQKVRVRNVESFAVLSRGGTSPAIALAEVASIRCALRDVVGRLLSCAEDRIREDINVSHSLADVWASQSQMTFVLEDVVKLTSSIKAELRTSCPFLVPYLDTLPSPSPLKTLEDWACDFHRWILAASGPLPSVAGLVRDVVSAFGRLVF